MSIDTKQEVVPAQPNQTPVVVSEENALMNLIAEMARGGQIDIVEKLIGMKNAQDDREAKLSFARDYAPMKAELPKIVKNKTNSHTKSGYADLSNINEVVDPILGKYGFATSTKVIDQTASTVTARAELIHKNGHTESMTLTMPLDVTGGNAKSGPQSIVSTISYLKRAAKCALLDIAAGDDDQDGNVQQEENEFIATEQAADIDLRARAFGDKYFADFMKFMNVETADKIMKFDYKRAINQLKATETEAANRRARAQGTK